MAEDADRALRCGLDRPSKPPWPPARARAEGASGSVGEDEGGDAACWAHLCCEECGVLASEAHHDGCSLGARSEPPDKRPSLDLLVR